VPCSDGDACNGEETCGGGACARGAPRLCDDGDLCTEHVCDRDHGCRQVGPSPFGAVGCTLVHEVDTAPCPRAIGAIKRAALRAGKSAERAGMTRRCAKRRRLLARAQAGAAMAAKLVRRKARRNRIDDPCRTKLEVAIGDAQRRVTDLQGAGCGVGARTR
jgi:hypothetical protein